MAPEMIKKCPDCRAKVIRQSYRSGGEETTIYLELDGKTIHYCPSSTPGTPKRKPFRSFFAGVETEEEATAISAKLWEQVRAGALRPPHVKKPCPKCGNDGPEDKCSLCPFR